MEFAGQPVFAVAATTVDAARRAAKLGELDIDAAAGDPHIDAAHGGAVFVLPPVHVTRGDADAALAAAPHRLHGNSQSGGQDHFYLEGQVALAMPREQGGMHVDVSRSIRAKCSMMVAHALGIARTTSSSSAGGWAVASAARKRRCRHSRASRRSSRGDRARR